MDKQEIAQELITRRKARNNFADFCKYVYPDYEQPWHVKKLCDKLEQVEKGEIKRLMVFMPPRCSKSLHASVLLPAYILGRKPKSLIVQAGYGDSISKKHSMDCRRIVTDKKYNNLYPDLCDKLTEKMKALTSIKEWTTSQSGSYIATGVGASGLLGRGADVLLIDDPFSSRADANSPAKREKVMDWWRSVARPRLQRDGAVIIINTRWHPDDLSGQLLREKDKDWEVLSLPAQKEGEYDALWPERFPLEELELIKKSIGLQEWTAQYMQEPVVKSGNIFRCEVGENIHIHDSLDDFPNIRYMRCWDLASSIKQRTGNDPDYTAGVLGAIKKDNHGIPHLWIKDIKHFREEAPKRNSIIRNAAVYDGGAVRIYIEAFASYKDAYITLKQALTGVAIINPSRLKGDKLIKASVLEPIFEAGNVHILKANWNTKFITEFLNFPLGSHDDIVDAVSIIGGESSKPRAGLMI